MKHQTCYQTVHQHILEIMPKIRKPAVGKFVAPYLTVTWGAFYANIFGWDNHHMTLRFAAEGEPCEMKYYLQNMLEFQEPDGFISNCMNDKGPCGKSRGPFHAQPFLAQNAAIFCSISNDVEFIKTIYPKLEKYLDYYFREMHSENGLYSWYYPYMSGIDNEICASVFPPGTILSVDLNSYLIMECRAMAYLAEKIGMEPAKFRTKAEQMTDSVNQYLWDENYGSYGNYNTVQKRVQFDYGADPLPGDTGKYCFMSCVGFPVLFAGVATPERAERMIRTYLMSPEHFLSNYGLRSISGKSEFYGNAVWGNPPRFDSPHVLTNSNWQGPVWVISNYFAIVGMARYGFHKEAELVTERLLQTLAASIEKFGFMRENFHAETGEPLYADNFASWNILADLLPDFASGNPPIDLFPWEK